jgi:nucleotide-binding universal stress UspA family protein
MKVEIKSILCPVDFSESSDHALHYAVALAQAYQAGLHLLHVVQPPLMTVPGDPLVPEFSSEVLEDIASAAQRRLDEIAETTGTDVPEVTTQIATGSAFMEIVTIARDRNIDLIVLGTHGRTGLAHVMIGSVAEKVVRKAPCPVLTVKHPEHEFVMP